MTGLIRPRLAASPGEGLLLAEHFQIAYATTDIDRACDMFAGRFGIAEFRRLEGPLPEGGSIRVELAWAGTIMYELLSASGPGSAIYMDRLPLGGFALRHHHLGFLIADEADWDALGVSAARLGAPILRDRSNPGFLRGCFVDAPELGHYLEYILAEPAGLAFFNEVPGNRAVPS